MLKRLIGFAIVVALVLVASGGVYAQESEAETAPDPSEYLSAEQLIDFNSLKVDVKTGLRDGFLPDLVSQQELTEQDKRDFFAAVVKMEKNAPPLDVHVHARDSSSTPHFHCSDPPSVVFSVGANVLVYTSVSCQESVLTLTPFVSIWSVHTGYNASAPSYNNATYGNAWYYETYHANTKYHYCWGFTASVNDLPTPRPTHINICRERRT